MYINKVVLNYLNLPDKDYSPSKIREALISRSQYNVIKANLLINHNKIFVMDLEGISIFHITEHTKCTINIMKDHIINHYQRDRYIPDCYYYGYNQKPIDIEKID